MPLPVPSRYLLWISAQHRFGDHHTSVVLLPLLSRRLPWNPSGCSLVQHREGTSTPLPLLSRYLLWNLAQQSVTTTHQCCCLC